METGSNNPAYSSLPDLRFSGLSTQNAPHIASPSSGSQSSTTFGTSSDIQDSDIVTIRGNGDIPNDDDETSTSETILSMVWYGGKLGAAYYDTESAVMHLLQETVEMDSFRLVESLLHELEPFVVVTSSKQDQRFLECLSRLTGNNLDDEVEEGDCEPGRQTDNISTTEDGRRCTLELIPNVSFAYGTSRHRLVTAGLPAIPDHYTDMEKELYIISKISLDCIATVRACGGLMKYLELHRVGVGLEHSEIVTPILDLRMFSPQNVMYIDKPSYRALQIFMRLDHPSVFKIGMASKEGLSLFGLMNRTSSRMGWKLFYHWFHRPVTDEKILDRRLDAVEYFVDLRNADLLARIQDSLRQMRNINRILKVMKTTNASVQDWIALHLTVISAVTISDFCRNAPRLPSQQPLPKILTDIAGCTTTDLLQIVNYIETIMDKEHSIIQNTFVVKAGIDSELDKKKDICNGLLSLLHEVALEECETYKEYITGCQIMYMPRIGYLLSLQDQQKFDPDEDIPGLQYMLTSDGIKYYKTARTAELDENPGDMFEDILDREIIISHQLQNTILQFVPALLEACQYIAELDCLLSFASVASDLGYVRPTITSENSICVKGGRHPLQERTVEQFVPNDITLNKKDSVVNVITGPNASGKSIYLKQIGLIVFMTHIGSFVPAVEATIGLVNKMYTRIKTMESISTGLSTFAVDLSQMSSSLDGADDRSLVLIDEFGKGTATSDGVSLLVGCLSRWIDMGTKAPFVVCSTHFHCLVRRKLLAKSPLVKYLKLKTLCDENGDLAYLYELKEGVAEFSFAAHLAQKVGVPREIVIRGREMTELLRRNAPVRRYDSQSTVSHMKKCEALTERFLSLHLDDDASVRHFKEFEIQRIMKDHKGERKRHNLAGLSTSTTRSDRSSDDRTLSDECEEAIPPPKRRN